MHACRWFVNVYKKAPRKALAHTALSDIRESIEELKYYRRVCALRVSPVCVPIHCVYGVPT